MTNEDIEYIRYVYDNKQKHIRPDVKRIVRIYNTVMPDGRHKFIPLRDSMCACSIRPYLIQLYNRLKKDGHFNESTPEIKDEKQDATRKVEKESVRDTSKKKAKTAHTIKNNV